MMYQYFEEEEEEKLSMELQLFVIKEQNYS